MAVAQDVASQALVVQSRPWSDLTQIPRLLETPPGLRAVEGAVTVKVIQDPALIQTVLEPSGRTGEGVIAQLPPATTLEPTLVPAPLRVRLTVAPLVPVPVIGEF